MKTLRLGLSALIVVLLGAGYIGSQLAAFDGTAADWAARIDQPPIVMLALVLLGLALLMAIARDRQETG